MHTIFVSPSQTIGKDITLSEPSHVKHLVKVLHLKKGERLRICDGTGAAYLCVISAVSSVVSLHVQERLRLDRVKSVHLAVACAIPKSSNMDDIVDKLTQLGVDGIFPLATERVVVKMDAAARKQKQARWERIALSASEQSQRRTLPRLEPVSSVHEVLKETADYELKLIPTLEGRRTSLRKVLEDTTSGKALKRILLFIGPEGDFTDAEIRLAQENGCIPVSLGPQVLRVETAAVAAASYILLHENL